MTDRTSRTTRPRLSLTLLAALLATLVAGAGTAAAQTSGGASPRIVGGHLATQPWQAQGYLRAGASVCGGTLVSARWFLTAGHCAGSALTVLAPGSFQITLGRKDRSVDPPAERFLVDQVIRHEAYSEVAGSESTDYDLALLHLSTPAPYEPLRLISPSETGLWQPGINAVVIGWGRQCEACSVSLQLLEAGVPIVSDPACAGAYGGAFRAATMVCAGYATGGVDTCQGDSGGPLMVPRLGEFVLAGITSWGHGCAQPGSPGVYTRVGAPELNAWIRARIPTAAIAISPASPKPTEPVTLNVGWTTPAGQTGPPAIAWDLDADGVFDDAAGPTATLPPRAAGTYVVRAQQTYPDGDRALAREVVGVVAPPPPPPPPPAVVAKPLARLVSVPRTVRVKSLLDARQPIRVSCSAACTIKGTLRLSGPTARSVGLTKRTVSVQVGSAGARFDRARSALVTIRLTKKAVSGLRKARSGTLSLRMTVTRGSRRQTLNELIGLRR